MTDKAHRTSVPRKSKPTTRSDNRPKRSPEMIARLIGLGVPSQLAASFPLTPHPTWRWCKKIKGKVWFFGKICDGWDAALTTYKDQIEEIAAGRTPAARNTDSLRLMKLCDHFMHFKRSQIDSGEVNLKTWHDYHQTAERVMKILGTQPLVEEIGPDDFETLRAAFAKVLGPVRMKNEIIRTRMIFNYAFGKKLIAKPVEFGDTFKPPSKKVLRRHRGAVRAQHGARMFTAEEIRKILDAADPGMKAMVLLAANGGLGNMDLAQLPLNAVDLDAAVLNFPRPKTGISRSFPLWPETAAALREWLAVRPDPKQPEDAHLVFLSKQRKPWFRPGRMVEEDGETKVKGLSNPLSQAFRWLLKKLDINGHRGFYCLRHGFETIAGDSTDQVAVDHIMGHADDSMAENYRERTPPVERLKAVTDHVRAWLFPSPAA